MNEDDIVIPIERSVNLIVPKGGLTEEEQQNLLLAVFEMQGKMEIMQKIVKVLMQER